MSVGAHGPHLSAEVGEDAVSCVGIAAFDRPDAPTLRALQTAGDVGAQASGASAILAVRRHGGGKAVALGPGIVRVAFRFAMDGRVAPDADRILNRAVRPVLRALRTLTPLAHYFGRDVVSLKVAGRRHDVGAVGFGHDASAGTAVFEAFLGVTRGPRADLVSLATLLPGLTSQALVDRLRASFADEGATNESLAPLPVIAAGPPWDVVRETPFARIGASASPLSVGGDFFVSRDFLDPLNERLRALHPGASAAAVRAVFAVAPHDGQVLIGVPTLDDLADTVSNALLGSSPASPAPPIGVT